MIKETAIKTITILIVLLGILLVYVIRDILVTFALAILLSAAIKPLVDILQARRLSKPLAIAFVYLMIIIGIFVIGLIVIPPFVRQTAVMINSIPDFLDRVQDWADSLQQSLGGGAFAINFGESINQILSTLPSLAGGLLRVTSNAFSVIFTSVLALVIAFYWLLERENIRATFLTLFPAAERVVVVDLWNEAENKLGQYVRGQLILGVAVGVTSFIGLQILGVEYSIVLAIIAGVTELIPMIGPFLGAVPAIIIAFLESPVLGLLVAILYLVIQQLENHILVPKVMERVVGLNPLLVLFSLLVGGTLLGVVGAILAVPMAAVIQVSARRILKRLARPV